MSVLCYHAVDPGWDGRLSVSPAAFRAQCEWLARARTVVDVDAVVTRAGRSYRPPPGVSAITFDDAFASLYEHAWPVLRDLGLPATVFVVARTLEVGGFPVTWVDDPPPWTLATLTLEQILEMQRSGVRFESHSREHHVLTDLSPSACEDDLRRSRESLSDALGRGVRYLAYPRGRHDAMVRACAERAGYEAAFALPSGAERGARYAIPRAGVWNHDSVRSVRTKSSAWYLPVRTSRAYPAALAARRRAPRGGG